MKHNSVKSIALVRFAIPIWVCTLISCHLNGQNWIQLAPSGQIPVLSAGGGGAAYDASSNRLMIFGGGDPRTNSVWVLSNADGIGASPVWTQLSPVGTPPVGRIFHALAYDAGSNRLIVFAGCSDSGCANLLNDVWILTNANGLEATAPAWVQLFPIGTPPAPRASLTAIYDPGTNRMTVFGGCTLGSFGCDVPQNDSWVLVNATGLGGKPRWLRLNPTGGPPNPRNSHIAAFDPDTNRMIIFGGVGGNTGILHSDVWVLSNANGLGNTPNWIQLAPAGTSNPGNRYNHTAIYNSATNQLVTFAGVSNGVETDDVWTLAHANGLGGTPTWTELFPTGAPPSARQNATSAFDAPRNRMMVFGGNNLNDSWILAKP